MKQPRKHAKLVPRVTCGRAMYQLRITRRETLYGCTDGHLRTIERVCAKTSEYTPPDAA